MPPTVIAAVAVLGVGATWLSGQPLVLRGLAALIAMAALVGSVVMRRWDSVAGLRVAELDRARGADEWRHEERVAELETELEESRELRGKLAQRLRSKRGELSALRNEHAALLRRYATAETERASALEGRRRLAIEAAAPTRALPPAARDTTHPARPEGPALPTGVPAELYARANAALTRLATTKAQAQAPAEPVTAAAPGESPTAPSQPLAPAPAPTTHTRPQIAAATAVAPAPPVRRRPAQGGFDFFGTQVPAATAPDDKVIEAVQQEDLADVVGQETAAEARQEARGTQPEPQQRTPEQHSAAHEGTTVQEEPAHEVIDLTEHDETEQLDVGGLRQAMGA